MGRNLGNTIGLEFVHPMELCRLSSAESPQRLRSPGSHMNWCCAIEPPSIEPSINGSITHDSFLLSSEAMTSPQLQVYLNALHPLLWASFSKAQVSNNKQLWTLHTYDSTFAIWSMGTGEIGSSLQMNDLKWFSQLNDSGTMLAWTPIHNTGTNYHTVSCIRSTFLSQIQTSKEGVHLIHEYV